MSEDDKLLQEQIIVSSGNVLLPESSAKIFHEKLAAYINELINTNFLQLVNWLYRLDVSEQKLKTLLAAQPNADAGFIIADMIIERQMQKIKSRKEFKGNATEIPENEKW